MQKILIILLLTVGQYTLSIDPNLMYRLGVVTDVPVDCNPVIGLSFLKFGIIESWLTSTAKDSVVRLTNELFTLKNGSLEVIKISYFTPESIGQLLKIIETHQGTHDKIQQTLADYFKGLPEFKDVAGVSQVDIELSTLIPAALQYVDMNTVYPKGGVQALFLAYLCSISQTREDIQSYYRGFLNNPNFQLDEAARVSTVTTKSKQGEKKLVKDYFCSVSQTTELKTFLDSFALKNKPYDALQDLVLLFFEYKDGSLVPNAASSDLINYISISHLGTMMRIIEQNNDPKMVIKKLGDYLVGLKILNRTTQEFLDEKSFSPLVVDVSESVALTQGNKPKYTYDFFMSVLNSCICSRFKNNEDIKNYSEGFFVHVTPDLIKQKEEEFACCIAKKSSHQDHDHDEEPDELWELEFEHGHHHEEGYYDISDAIVERTLLLDLAKKQVENSVEAIIFQLKKVAQLQKELKKEGKELNSNNIQVAFPLAGAFYTNKKRKERQDILNKEIADFNQVVVDLKNIPGVSYQRIENKDQAVIAIANSLTQKSDESVKIDLNSGPQIIQANGFVPSSKKLSQESADEVVLPTNNQHQVLIPRSSDVVCSGMQPTLGNLVLGLQKVFNLKVIPSKNIRLTIDSQVAARYFNEICRTFNWQFDLSNFDVTQPIELSIGQTTLTIDLHKQRLISISLEEKNVQEAKAEEKQKRISLPAAGMNNENDSIVPSFSDRSKGLLQKFDPLQLAQNTKASESLVAAAIITGTIQAQEFAKYQAFMKAAWFGNIQLILQAQRALFEFVSLIAPKSYERVMSKFNEIMNNQAFIDSNLVGYELQKFFEDSNSEYRPGITAQDINDYFEYAPAENILLVLDEINKLNDFQRYNLIANKNFSKESLAFLFERVPIEDLMLLFNDMKSDKRVTILKKLPQDSLKKFVDDLSLKEFYTLFKGITSEQMGQLEISATENVLDTLYQRIQFYSRRDQQLGEHSSYPTISELKDMNAKQLEDLALNRQKAYEAWYTKSENSRGIKPVSSEIRPVDIPTSSKHFIPTVRTPTTIPIHYRRSLRPESWRRYIAEHGADIIARTGRDVVRSGLHGLK